MGILKSLKNGLIVSCQAFQDEPLFGDEIMVRMALCAAQGGAVGIRANSAVVINSIKRRVDLPLIGLWKQDYSGSEVYITPTIREVDAVLQAGADIVAIDATSRARPNGEKLEDIVRHIRANYNCLMMADISCLEEGIYAEQLGFDIVSTTMSGYTSYSRQLKEPDFQLVNDLFMKISIPVVAGDPAEWITFPDPETFKIEDLRNIWQQGTTPNGVFGLKTSSVKLDNWVCAFQRELQLPEGLSRPQIWEQAFPSCKHIFMTRRNKVRLAVSWWRAIVSGECHRVHGSKPLQEVIEEKYSFDAINHLFVECSMREAGIAAFFTEGRIVPMTIVYEDFIERYEETVMQVLKFLDIPTESIKVASPYFDPLADDIAEKWVQRFRQERQVEWQNIAW